MPPTPLLIPDNRQQFTILRPLRCSILRHPHLLLRPGEIQLHVLNLPEFRKPQNTMEDSLSFISPLIEKAVTCKETTLFAEAQYYANLTLDLAQLLEYQFFVPGHQPKFQRRELILSQPHLLLRPLPHQSLRP